MQILFSIRKDAIEKDLRDRLAVLSLESVRKWRLTTKPSQVTPMLSNMLNDLKEEKKISLAVADPKLGNAITKLPGLHITAVSDSSTSELYRAIREHLPSLIPGLLPDEINTMSLGLSHSLSRHKLKFSPDKVDTMIIQAIALLDDLDKELNTYAMRVKEWYGWHFPEMARIINDNLAYSRVIISMGMRSNCSNTDLSDILPEEIEGAVKAAAEISMGTEITDEDLENIQALAEQVIGFTEYRQQLSSYLSARMQAIAPNLTALVGDLVGARLIAHAGSLMNLAKSPASTVQILGAEKALFRALKTKHDTPKYGLIYHASLIGQASGKNKGKIARMLATKATLGIRVDALSEWGTAGEGTKEEPAEEEKSRVGVAGRGMVERRLRQLEGKPLKAATTAIGPDGQRKQQQQQPGKWEIKEARKYNPDADGISADAAPTLTSGEDLSSTSKKRKHVEEIQPVKAITAAEEDDEEDEEDDEEEEDSDESEEEVDDRPRTNGVKTSTSHSIKEARKMEAKMRKREAKAKRKAERVARKTERAEKRAARARENAIKKRKHPDEDGETPKKKKHKSKTSSS